MILTHALSGHPIVILLVEDNLAHAELVKRNFEVHQVANRLYHVTDGEAALDYLFRRGRYADPEQSPRPHLILLDLRLPRIDGLEVLKTIKASQDLRPIPIVILTTSGSEQDVVRAYQYYANSYLVKPVEFAQFTALMEELGFYWLVQNYDPCRS
jgi:CheY-like chemotaxis protein